MPTKSTVATQAYKDKTYDIITIQVRKDADITKDMIKAAAESSGQSPTAYILQAIKEKMSI